jgi:hypothetical protein
MEAGSISNQQAMEQALGKLVMDDRFRDAFFIDPAVATEAAGIPLTDRERNALARIRPGALAAFQRYLEAKRVGDCRRRQAQDVEDPPDEARRPMIIP